MRERIPVLDDGCRIDQGIRNESLKCRLELADQRFDAPALRVLVRIVEPIPNGLPNAFIGPFGNRSKHGLEHFRPELLLVDVESLPKAPMERLDGLSQGQELAFDE